MELFAKPRILPAATTVFVVLGLGWVGLCWRLAAAGEAPSATGPVPVAAEDWYRLQALWVLPVLTLCWGVLGGVGHALARRWGGQGSVKDSFGALGLGWAGSLGLLLVVPDLLIYELFGMDGLRLSAVVILPLAAVGAWINCLILLGTMHQLPPRRAALAALGALLAATLVGAPFLR